LSLSKGSGIATYGRNLGRALSGLGYETQVLYGPPEKPGGDNLLNEIALFDAPKTVPQPKRRRWYQRGPVPHEMPRAVRVIASGEVVDGLGSDTAAGASVAWSAFDIFHGANRQHGRSGAFTTLGFGAPGDRPFELMHWTCPLPIRAERIPNVYTIHDVVPLRFPYATLDNKARFQSLCAWICREADHVVTVSETTRRDVIRIFGVDEARITNAYQAVDLPPEVISRSENDVAAEVEAIFGLAWRRYFLFFGAIEPKKNLARLIEAYLGSGAADPLVIVGGQSWLEESQTGLLSDSLIGRRRIEDNIVRQVDRVRRYEFLPRTTLASLIRGAKATLFPSLYEGFGLPVLESMLLGTPVLTSTGGALPEVAGDAAILVDPYDVHAIRRGIQALEADGDLRDSLRARGAGQALKFSSSAYRERLGAIYQGLL